MSDDVSDGFIMGYKAAPIATGKELEKLVQAERDREAAGMAEANRGWAEFHKGAMDNVKKGQTSHTISNNAFMQYGEEAAAIMQSMAKLDYITAEGFVTNKGVANNISQQEITDLLARGK